MPIAQLLELWKKIEVEPMEIEVRTQEGGRRSRSALWTVANRVGLSRRIQLSCGCWHGRDVDVLCTWFIYVAM